MPDHIKEQAREMARQELQRRLEELDMSSSDAEGYGALLTAVQTHIASLHDLLESGFQVATESYLKCPNDLFRSCSKRGRASEHIPFQYGDHIIQVASLDLGQTPD